MLRKHLELLTWRLERRPVCSAEVCPRGLHSCRHWSDPHWRADLNCLPIRHNRIHKQIVSRLQLALMMKKWRYKNSYVFMGEWSGKMADLVTEPATFVHRERKLLDPQRFWKIVGKNKKTKQPLMITFSYVFSICIYVCIVSMSVCLINIAMSLENVLITVSKLSFSLDEIEMCSFIFDAGARSLRCQLRVMLRHSNKRVRALVYYGSAILLVTGRKYCFNHPIGWCAEQPKTLCE